MHSIMETRGQDFHKHGRQGLVQWCFTFSVIFNYFYIIFFFIKGKSDSDPASTVVFQGLFKSKKGTLLAETAKQEKANILGRLLILFNHSFTLHFSDSSSLHDQTSQIWMAVFEALKIWPYQPCNLWNKI